MYSHGAVAARYFGQETVEAVWADYTKTPAPIRNEVRLALGMLHKLTLDPHNFGADDIRLLLSAGLRPAAIEHAILVGGYLFNMHTRLIDALGCDMADEHIAPTGRILNQIGKKPRQDRLSNGKTMAYTGTLPQTVQAWLDTIKNGKGEADPNERLALLNRSANWTGGNQREAIPLPDVLANYADTIAHKAVDITDDHITAMKNEGYSELEIFEFTFSAATGAGIARLEIGWQALAEAIERQE